MADKSDNIKEQVIIQSDRSIIPVNNISSNVVVKWADVKLRKFDIWENLNKSNSCFMEIPNVDSVGYKER